MQGYTWPNIIITICIAEAQTHIYSVLETKASLLVPDQYILVRTNNFLPISSLIEVWIFQNFHQDQHRFQLGHEHYIYLIADGKALDLSWP